MKTYEQAKAKAISLLSRRRYTEKEIADRLKRFGVEDDEIIDSIIEWGNEYHFINDAEYARDFARNAANIKGYGKRRIADALRFKGIDREMIADALLLLDDEVDEAEKLKPMVAKRLKGDFERKNIDKVIRHFIGKGYKYGDIKAAVEDEKCNNEFPEENYFE